MFRGMQIVTFRMVILILPVLAQVYLFLRARKAILTLRLERHFRQWAIVGAALLIGLLFAMNVCILFRYVTWVDPPTVPRILFFYVPAVWTFGSIFCALLLCLAQAIGGLVKTVERVAHRGGSHDPGRRRFVRLGMVSLAAAPFVVSGYGAAYIGGKSKVMEVTLAFGRKLEVVQLTDIHAGVYMSREDIRRHIDTVIALKPDLVLLTGDFISTSMVFLPECLEELARVKTRYGSFACPGNHERWYGGTSELRAVFRKYGIPLLINAHQVIETEQGAFTVAGIDDLRAGQASLEDALHGADPQLPTILLSHRPEIFPEAAGRGIPLTLAGHYHGGQIKLSLPGFAISPAHLVTPYPEGLFRIDGSHLYVSRGIGTTFTPIRLGVPPEVTLFHLI